MKTKLQQRKSGGFTIIEVLIVLAIAGLILLVVFLAVPALQRNAHNTSIKNDVSGLLAGMTEFVSNNNGKVPSALSNKTTAGLDIGATTDNTANVKLGYIDGTKVTLGVLSGSTNAPAVGNIALYTNAKCGTTVGQAVTTGATSRNFVALYTLEGGAKQCQES